MSWALLTVTEAASPAQIFMQGVSESIEIDKRAKAPAVSQQSLVSP